MAVPYSVPDRIDGPLVVVGDVHGESGLLERLLARLLARPDCAGRWIVFVGDLIDRGPNPRAVVQRVLDLRQQHGKVTACMGNHELALLGALGLFPYPPEHNWDYRYAGYYSCRSTCASYARDAIPADPEWPEKLARRGRDLLAYREKRRVLFNRLREWMPEAHRSFLLGLPWAVVHPDYLIVHAGIRPDQPVPVQLEALARRDFTDPHPVWLCDRDLIDTELPSGCDQTVVLGHVTVCTTSIFHATQRKVCVDTGSGYPQYGSLSAVLLPEREILSVGYTDGSSS